MPTINDHELIASTPLWNSEFDAGERFDTEIAAALRGGEDRAALIQKPWRSMRLPFQFRTPAERGAFDLAVREGLRTGRVAAPYWPRPCETTAFGSDTIDVADTWTWAAGDYAWLEEDGAGEVVQIASIDALELTLEDTIAGTYTAGCALLYPLLFGMIEREHSLISPDIDAPVLQFSEPSALGDYAGYSCAAAAEPPETAAFNVCDGNPELTLTLMECPLEYRISWPPVFAASAYVIYEADTEEGTYTVRSEESVMFDAPSGVYYIDVRIVDLLNASRWIKVAPSFGESEGTVGAPVEVPTITIERVMRTVQERRYRATKANGYTTAGGYALASGNEYVDWPDRVLGGAGDPGNYPADAYYLADLTAAEAATAQTLVQYIADVLKHNGWLAFYFNTDDMDALDGVASHTMLSTTQLPALTVTTGNYLASLETLAEYCCELVIAKVPTVRIGSTGVDDREVRVGDSYAYLGSSTSASCVDSVDDSLDAWNADSWTETPDFTLAVYDLPGAEYDEFGGITGNTRYFFACRGRSQADLSMFPSGTAAMFYKLVRAGGAFPDSEYEFNAYAPQSALGTTETYAISENWMRSVALSVNGVRETSTFGNISEPDYLADCLPDTDDGYIRTKGWQATGEFAAVEVTRLQWTYTL